MHVLYILDSKTEIKQAPLPSAIPPSVSSSTQLQVENISPVPPLSTKQPSTTAMEPSRLVQTLDTSFKSKVSSDVSSMSSTLTNTQFPNSMYGGLSASGIPLVTVGSYMTNLHYQGSQGLPIGTLYTGQNYISPTQGVTLPMQYPPTQLQAPQPSGYPPLHGGGNMYSIPAGNLGAVQNPSNFGPDPTRGMGQPPQPRHPPPVPPAQLLSMPQGHPHSRAEFTWPRQFGVPPQNQPPMRGGWMPR